MRTVPVAGGSIGSIGSTGSIGSIGSTGSIESIGGFGAGAGLEEDAPAALLSPSSVSRSANQNGDPW
jgi:hypothetical protein